MSERFQKKVTDFRASEFLEAFQPLPGWLADRLLRSDEKVVWVRGPRFNPSWERYITHPGLILLALAFGAICVGVGSIGVKITLEDKLPFLALAGGLVIATILVLGVSCGYFTRLVVTNCRLVILQGYEIVRSWSIDDLPPRFVHYNLEEDRRPSIDLDAVKKLLGGSSEKFTDAKSILSFVKQIDRIKKNPD
jgi:hypothetical protein